MLYGTVTSAVRQGKRLSQEDRHYLFQDHCCAVLAVMDGHGGNQASDFCSKRISVLMKDQASSLTLHERVESIFSSLVVEMSGFREGTTLSIAWIQDDQVIIGILGDSPVMVVDKEKKRHLSPEHNASNSAELEAAKKRGAYCSLLGYIDNPWDDRRKINLTRALGDMEYGTIMSRSPEIYTVKRPRFVIVSSDGFLNKQLEKDNTKIARMLTRTSTADQLIEWAENRSKPDQLWDNTTILLWTP